jgi:uncharacterized protein YndB with AHSA1/START domain
MTTQVEKTIVVSVPVSTAYNQWTQFEDFPQFMGGITSVTQLSDDRLQWVAEIAGVRRQWQAKIVEQVPDQKVAWAATEGATNAGAVTFADAGGGQTTVHLSLEYEPEGLVEKVGDKLNIVENQAEGDLERFKAFIESEGYASGAWRGTVDEGARLGAPGVEDAAASRGDAGKAGVSGKAVAAGVGLAGVAAAAAAVVAGKKSDDTPDQPSVTDTTASTPPISAGSMAGQMGDGDSVGTYGMETDAMGTDALVTDAGATDTDPALQDDDLGRPLTGPETAGPENPTGR